MNLSIDNHVSASPDANEAFHRWWSQHFDWDHTNSGVYEQRFRAAFLAGWHSSKENMK